MMKLTKRILCLVMAMTLTFALCACGTSQEDKNPTNNTTTTTNNEGGNLDGENTFNDGSFGAW